MSAENYIFIDFFAVKVDGSDVTMVSVKRFSYRQIPWLTSFPSTLTAKKSMKMKYSADNIHYNFSEGHFTFSKVRGTLIKSIISHVSIIMKHIKVYCSIFVGQ